MTTTTANTNPSVLEPLGLTAAEMLEAVPQMCADLATTLNDGAHIATLQAWAKEWLRAWNAHDLDAAVALVTDDIVYEDPSMLGDHIVGKAQFRAFVQMIWRAFPDLTFDIPTTPYAALSGNGMAVPWRTTGTFTGDFRGGPSPLALAPTGRSFDLRGVDLYEYRDGLLSRWVSVVDSMDLARQLGVVPTKDSPLFPLMIGAERLAAPLLRLVGRRSR